jgi:hypothetical protein
MYDGSLDAHEIAIVQEMDRSIPSIPCAVCRRTASNRTPPDFDGVIVRCASCRDYDVSGTVLRKLEQLPIADRLVVLGKARNSAEPGRRPSITRACF